MPHPGHINDETLGRLRGGPGIRDLDEHFPVNNYFPHQRAVSRESLVPLWYELWSHQSGLQESVQGCGGAGWHLLKVCLAFLFLYRGHFVGACSLRDLEI